MHREQIKQEIIRLITAPSQFGENVDPRRVAEDIIQFLSGEWDNAKRTKRSTMHDVGGVISVVDTIFGGGLSLPQDGSNTPEIVIVLSVDEARELEQLLIDVVYTPSDKFNIRDFDGVKDTLFDCLTAVEGGKEKVYGDPSLPLVIRKERVFQLVR